MSDLMFQFLLCKWYSRWNGACVLDTLRALPNFFDVCFGQVLHIFCIRNGPVECAQSDASFALLGSQPLDSLIQREMVMSGCCSVGFEHKVPKLLAFAGTGYALLLTF